eukprot:CAMPEP_0178999878 /NCGR_PEP_ID=MMETSP0795-20121207/10344_1 /TAXON_ID=88552 /ORGANISM="Amoebophrya sp., Strain Ameob2" /LENGTH=664 /DNA_ID=CAMNT_0020692779 /DNA_START=276 /DNA_END=2270 /DNA_ORIENTATION=+
MNSAVPQATPQAGQPGGAPQFASLYVGDLDPEVTEAMLYEIFNTVGPVASIRVCRDSVTRRSLGYAYVNFHSAADAERVMDTLNYSTIKGRSCRIMWSHRDPNLRKTGNGNVFVKNLDKAVDNKALYDTFSLFGNIPSCKVATDQEGKSRGYGFVHYETAEAAKQAIEKVNNMQIGEKTVYVGEFIPRDGRTPTEITNFTNIYVKNYPEEWDEAKLVEEFGKFGTITSSMTQKDKKSRNFAFINYETAEEARKAIETMHEKDFRSEEEKEKFPDGPAPEKKEGEKDGGSDDDKEGSASEKVDADDHPEHLMFCSRAMTKVEREAMLKNKFKSSWSAPIGVNLYIKNLPEDCTDSDLRTMFIPFGEITSARVMMDAKARSKGFGFVCYKTPDEATKAVTEMHLKTVKGKPLYVGLAEKKDERVNRLAQRYKGEKGQKGGLVTFDGKGMMPGKGGMMAGPQAGASMAMQGYPGYNANAMQQPMNNGVMGQKGQMMPMQMPQMLGGGMAQNGRPMQMQFPGQRPPMMGYPAPQMMQNPMMKGQQMMPMQMQKGFPGQGKGAPGQMQPGPGQRVGGPVGPGMQGAGGPRTDQQLTPQMLASAPAGMQKQMLGEKLYPAVSRLQPELAGKITGMMLEMDNSELLLMLESETQLRQKVDEALRVLQAMPK